MIKVVHTGNFNGIERFFNRVLKKNYLNIISDYAERGLEALKDATPKDSGITANSWNYQIEDKNGVTSLTYMNDSMNEGQHIVILLVYGHGTRNGRYVEGIDFVSPAIAPVFKKLADKIWREVTE